MALSSKSMASKLRNAPVSNASFALLLTARRLLESGMLADAEVKCPNRTWKVHKIIVCTRSDWFKKALMGPFEARSILPALNAIANLDITGGPDRQCHHHGLQTSRHRLLAQVCLHRSHQPAKVIPERGFFACSHEDLEDGGLLLFRHPA